MKKQADELVLTMNRAAEAAVPEAKQLLVDAVKKMSVQDAKGILTGGEPRRPNTSSARPKAISANASSRSSRRPPTAWDSRSSTTRSPGQGAALGLVKEDQATIESYVTQKALDGLYFMIGEQEKAFRTESARRFERHRQEGVRRNKVGGNGPRNSVGGMGPFLKIRGSFPFPLRPPSTR